VLINLIPASILLRLADTSECAVAALAHPGNATLQLVRDGIAGPEVVLKLASSAPVMFQSDLRTVIATHGNGPLVTAASPAKLAK